MTTQEQRICMEVYATKGPKAAAEQFGITVRAANQMAHRHGVNAPERDSPKRRLTREEKAKLEQEARERREKEAKSKDLCQTCHMVFRAGHNIGTTLCITGCLLGKK